MFSSTSRISQNRPPIGKWVLLTTAFGLLLLAYSYKTGTLGIEVVLYLLALVPSVILHEISHGWMALRFGDETARREGRLSFNPLRHIDPVGTVIVPTVLAALGWHGLGWAKPVPVNTSRMTRTQSLLVSLVGPFTNFVLAFVAGMILRFAFLSEPAWHSASWWIFAVVYSIGLSNVVLGVFNLIPIPPLDGSAIFEWILPDALLQLYMQFRQYAIFLLMIIVISGNLPLSKLFDPALNFWATHIVGLSL